nr:uncharacterized protein LOC109187400 [Ipomoea batatas]
MMEFKPTLLSQADGRYDRHLKPSFDFARSSLPGCCHVLKNPKLSRTPTFISRSFSDQCLSFKDSLDFEPPLPKSVLLESSKLQLILSGKEYIRTSEHGGIKDGDGNFNNRESW